MKRPVQTGLQRRSLAEVRHVGISGQILGAGQGYLSVMTDIGHPRLLEVTPDCTTEAADALRNTLPEEQPTKVKAACTDMRRATASKASDRRFCSIRRI